MANKWKHMPRDVAAAMKWAENHPDRDPANGTSWANHCLASSRQMYGMGPVGSSAKVLADRLQKHGRFLHRCKNPKDKGWWRDMPKGAWILSDVGTYGHSWVAAKDPKDDDDIGKSWSTDYTGPHGTLKRAPRNLPRWGNVIDRTQFWICGLELNGIDYWIKGIDCPYPKHEGKH